MAESARVSVLVKPDAHRSEVVGFRDGVLQVKVAAPPVEGKANQELIRFLAEMLGVGKSNLTIEKGTNSRRKVIRIAGWTQDRVLRLLESSVTGKE